MLSLTIAPLIFHAKLVTDVFHKIAADEVCDIIATVVKLTVYRHFIAFVDYITMCGIE